MKRPLLVFVVLLLVLGGAFWWLVGDQGDDAAGKEDLLVHCAAGLRKPMNEIARRYEEEFGVKVDRLVESLGGRRTKVDPCLWLSYERDQRGNF